MKINRQLIVAIEPIATTGLASVTGGFNTASGLLQHIRNIERGGSVFRPPPPPNLRGSLTGDFNRNLGTWIRFGN